MKALDTDLYQLTMAAGYWSAGKVHERATFELFVRRLPRYRNFIVACGLQQALDYLLNLRFTEEQIAYLKTLPHFARVDHGFWQMLRDFRFTGDVFAVREGTPIFAGEPMLTVRAPVVEAQIPETYLLATLSFQSMIATKAARVVEAAGVAKTCVEFGTRRAHSPEAGVLAGRAAYVGGCSGTSNVEAGFRYNIPVYGTAAHSWVLSFESETEAFAQLQKLLGRLTTHLIDSYDALEGTRRAASLGRPLWGVRLDSGNLMELAPAVRRILDDAGLPDAKIMVTGDLNEYKILELMAANLPIDSFGVGTDLATSADSPNLGAIYKMVEMESEGVKRYTAKFAGAKTTIPGAKQVFRFADHDIIAHESECYADAQDALLKPVILNGQLVEPLPNAKEAREYATQAIRKLPKPLRTAFEREGAWRVEYSLELKRMLEQARLSKH